MQEMSAMILPEGMAYDGATLIPIDLGPRLITRAQNPVSIVELGKKLLNAAKNGDTEEVRELMTKGAPFTTDWLGTSPLHFAALNNHLETCEVLLRAGISRDARTKVDRTPLHLAAYEGHVAIVESLILNGADVDAKDMLKMTALHWAVQNEHMDTIVLLLKHGANPDVVNKFEKTPADIAVDLNRMDILQQLQFITKDPLVINEDLVNVDLSAIEPPHEKMVTDIIEPVLQEEEEEEEQDQVEEIAEHLSEEAPITNIKYTNLNEFVNINKHIDNSSEIQETIDMTDSMNILKEHGITFLPNDDSSVVASAVENGHSLVLTEVGKQVLKSTKPLVKIPVQKTIPNKLKGRKLVTVTAQQLLAMIGQKNGVLKTLPMGTINVSDKIVRKPIVMDKNKIIINGMNAKVQKKSESCNDIETIRRQLVEARAQVEQYKKMFKHKEAEAEDYKRQLQIITQSK